MKKIISLLFVAGVLNTVAAQKITMYSTTASERWTSQKVTVLKHASQTPEVSVYTDSLLQHVTMPAESREKPTSSNRDVASKPPLCKESV